MAFKPIDPKRDEFRRYLERSGVIESLTKVFVRLVKERPENALDYLKTNLGDSLQQADSVAYLQAALDDARAEINRLRVIIENIDPTILDEPVAAEAPPVGRSNGECSAADGACDGGTANAAKAGDEPAPPSAVPQQEHCENVENPGEPLGSYPAPADEVTPSPSVRTEPSP